MDNMRISSEDLADNFGIIENKAEFINDLNLFFNIIAFDDSKDEYFNIIKQNFNEYMKEWNIDINKNFTIISKYIQYNKLPYKILKDKGFENIKSDKFIISMLVELYAIKIIISNKNYIDKNNLIDFIYKEFLKNSLQVKKQNIILKDLNYIFKDKDTFYICKSRLIKNKVNIEKTFSEIIHILEKRKKIKIELNYIINDIKDNDILLLKREIEDLKAQNKLKDEIIDQYIENENRLKNEIEKIQNQNIHIGKEQYIKAMIDLVRNLNDSNNGNLLDRLYCYLKGKDEKNLPFIISNLLNVLRQSGIYPRETIKLGEIVPIEEYSFYNYRLNKDISDIKLDKGKVVYPAWFYNDKEILKPYVNIKGE